jgi:hypothetical protein
MTPTSSISSEALHTFRALRMGGDWACAHGDFSALRGVARRLTAYVPDPVRGDLAALADSCVSDPDRAAVLWDRLTRGPDAHAR